MNDAFDPAKDAENLLKHGVSLARFADMEVAHFVVDDRYDYGEIRYRAWGYIEGVAYCLAYTIRDGQVRPISLRRAHLKEMQNNVP